MSTPPFNREQFARTEALYFEALELPREQWERLLAEKCADDVDLRREVRAMLELEPSRMVRPLQMAMSEALSHAGAPGRPAHPPRNRGLRYVGQRIGPYRIEEVIGEGGMGIVFRAEQEEPVRRAVALKLIRAGMDSPDVVARFESERQALALMSHPNVARVFDAGTTDEGRHYFVMEYVAAAMPITRWCDDNNASIAQRLSLFIDVCEAVHHAHQRGVIHRDLKPSNVLVTSLDDRPVPKVIDFGVAKAVERALTGQTLITHAGQIIGTPQYMSPEQADLGHADVDTRSDVYALGVILFELVTGSPPIDREGLRDKGLDQILNMVRQQDAPRPSTRIGRARDDDDAKRIAAQRQTDPTQLVRMLRGELDWIICKALEKDRRRRYDTAAALAEDLRRCLAHEPVLAGPPSTLYRVRKFVRRHRIPVAAGAVLMLAIVAGVIGTTWQAVRAMRAERTALEQKALADRRFAEVRQLAESMLFQLDETLRTEGPTRTRQLMVTTALKYLDRLTAESGIDRRLRFTVMKGYQRVGNMQFVTGADAVGGSLGDLDGATASYFKALAMARELHAEEPSDRIRAEIGFSLLYLGDTQIASEDFDGALRSFDEAIEIFGEMAQRDETYLRADHHVTLALDRKGQVFELLGRSDAAIAAYRESLRLREQYISKRPDDSTNRMDVAVSRQKVQQLEEPETADTETWQHMQQMLPILQQRLANEPDNPLRLRALVIGLSQLAQLKYERGMLDEAVADIETVLPMERRLLSSDPANVMLQEDLIRSLGLYGKIMADRRRYAEAVQYFEETLSLHRQMSAIAGERAGRRRIAAALRDLVVPYRELGRFDDAIKCAGESVELNRQRVAAYPNDVTRNALTASLQLLEETLWFAGRADEASSIRSEIPATRPTTVPATSP